ncbi:hypothetical protein ACTMUQ_42805 [Streptomyces sp. SD11]|uniref:hypothetical protein n=1 Tax=Streptomyces sp. SD11 TaxID=3452209 RepID=UPI003F8B72D1
MAGVGGEQGVCRESGVGTDAEMGPSSPAATNRFRPLPGVLARVLAGSAADRPTPPVVLLARARRVSAVAGLVGTVLADHASPAREAYGLGVVLADEPCAVLDPVVGPELIAAYRADLL